MNVPYTAIHFATYESCKKYFSQSSDEETLAVQLGAGGIAGGIAAAATTPFDVVKTRLQLEGVHSATRYGTIAVVRFQFFMYIMHSLYLYSYYVRMVGAETNHEANHTRRGPLCIVQRMAAQSSLPHPISCNLLGYL